MNHKVKSLVVLFSLAFVAYTWPWEAPAAKNKQVISDSSSPQEKLPVASVQNEKIIFQDSSAALNPVPIPQVPVVTPDKLQVPSVPSFPPKPLVNDNLLDPRGTDQLIKPLVNNSATNPIRNNPVPKIPAALPVVKPDVHNVENQIQDIIALNRGIKQTQEVQRIVEQAQIHQKLLTGLANPPVPKASVSASDADEMLRQEKIRLISQETEKNRKIIETIRQTGQ